MRGPVDGDDLAVDPDVQAEAVEELLGGLQRQILLLLDQPAHEVRQPAVARTRHARSVPAP